MPQVIGTRVERMEQATAFLLNYQEQYGYLPSSQAVGRFCLTIADAWEVWRRAREDNA